MQAPPHKNRIEAERAKHPRESGRQSLSKYKKAAFSEKKIPNGLEKRGKP